MSKKTAEISAAATTKVIEDGKLTSLTQVSKMLGLGKGSVSGSVAKRLRELVPTIDQMLAANKPAKPSKPAQPVKPAKGDPASEVKPKVAKKVVAAKPTKVKPVGKSAFPVPDCTPFRHSNGKISGYAQVFSILYANREKGIPRADLISKYQAWSKKPQINASYDVATVISSRENGSSHRSVANAAQTYYVERQSDWLKLHLISAKK